MVKLLMGSNGSGKTKKLVDLVVDAVNSGDGDVVVVEKERKLTYDVPYQARLIDAGAYDIGSYEFLKGFLCGIHSGNYDITHVFIDDFFKIVDDKSDDSLVGFVGWLNRFSARESIDFILSISSDAEAAPAEVKEFII